MTASEHHVDIVDPPGDVKLEAISSRLRQTLIHPDKTGVLLGLHYTPDGRRLIAGHAASGIVQVWDALSGRQLTSIETGQRRVVPFNYLHLSPNGRLLHIARGNSSSSGVKKDGKRLIRWDFSSDVRFFDLVTGELRRTIGYPPPHGIYDLTISPDGATIVTYEGISGIYDGPPKRFVTLWDTRTGRQRLSLPVGLAAFSPDSKTLVMSTFNDKFEATGLQFIETATGRVRLSVPSTREHEVHSNKVFSPNGKLLAGVVRSAGTAQYTLKLWDAASGREVASFEGRKPELFRQPLFSPDGERLAIVNRALGQPRMLLIDVTKRQLVKTHVFGDTGTVRQPVFSPDGKWLAVISQKVPELLPSAKYREVALLPQPHIHLIESATGEVRETIVAPPGFAVALCFSPDGKTLASGGDGRVLLWDMTKPPGANTAKRKE